MTAVANTIFKIKAHTDFITTQPDQLSFRKGQPFYALSIDYEKGYYFVSTQYAIPFSRNAVNGLVPISMFDKVELLSKDTSYIKRKKVVLDKDTQSVPARKQSLTHNPDWKIIMESKIKSVIVLSIVENQYQIRVERQEASHVIKRSLQDILLVAQNVKEFKAIEATESELENIQLLLNTVLVYGNNDFFNPKSTQELFAGQLIRRDSGISEKEFYDPTYQEPSVTIKSKRKSSFARFFSIFSNSSSQ